MNFLKFNMVDSKYLNIIDGKILIGILVTFCPTMDGLSTGNSVTNDKK